MNRPSQAAYMREYKRESRILMDGVPQIPDALNAIAADNAPMTQEQEEAYHAAIQAACGELRRRIGFPSNWQDDS